MKYGSGDLLKAAQIIESIPDMEFDLEHWWLPDGMAFDDDRNRVYRVSDSQCGCAVGHLAHVGAFGLTEEIFKAGYDIPYVQMADLFAIPLEVSKFLFSQYSYRNKRGQQAKEDVIKRLRFCAKEKEAGRL